MRKKTNFIFWIFLVLSVFLLINTISSSSDRIRGYSVKLFSPIQRSVLFFSNNFSKNLEVFKDTKKIAEEIKTLREENNSLYVKMAELNRLKQENLALKNALNIDLLKEKDFLFVQVTGKDLLNQSITVYHDDDVKRGSFVVTSEGVLIGIVESSQKNISRIRLLSHPDTSIEVKVQNEDEPIAIIKGGQGGRLNLEFLPKDKKIERGDFVVTLPSVERSSGGVFVGRILEVDQNDIEAFYSASIWQGIDYRYLDNLFILK
jgi:rod shape-determining protein MreC